MGEPIFQEGFDHEAFTQGYQVISEQEAYKRYDNMINECYGDIKIMNVAYEHSDVLKDFDAIAYRCGFNDYTSHLEEDNIFVEGITEPPKES
jgi:hypothetical protein